MVILEFCVFVCACVKPGAFCDERPFDLVQIFPNPTSKEGRKFLHNLGAV